MKAARILRAAQLVVPCTNRGGTASANQTLCAELQVSASGAADIQRVLLYTLRHFPLHPAVARVDDCLEGLQDWLQPEDLTTNAK
jgi:hypothetical protein